MVMQFRKAQPLLLMLTPFQGQVTLSCLRKLAERGPVREPTGSLPAWFLLLSSCPSSCPAFPQSWTVAWSTSQILYVFPKLLLLMVIFHRRDSARTKMTKNGALLPWSRPHTFLFLCQFSIAVMKHQVEGSLERRRCFGLTGSRGVKKQTPETESRAR